MSFEGEPSSLPMLCLLLGRGFPGGRFPGRGLSRRGFPRSRFPGRRFLGRHLGTGATGLGQSNGDRLLAALHLLAGPPAFQRALLPFVHGLADFLLRLLAVSSHGCSPHRATRALENDRSTSTCVALGMTAGTTALGVQLLRFVGGSAVLR